MEQMSNPQYLLQLMNLMGPAANTSTGTSAASSSNSASLQQQFQQLQTLLTLSALGGSDMNAANLTASLASLAAGMGTSTAATPSSTTLPAKSGSADVLNLSKRSTIADTTTKLSLSSAISGTISKSNAASSTAVKPVFTNADACLSTGLSTSAINKLSQMSVPELLAYSNLAPVTTFTGFSHTKKNSGDSNPSCSWRYTTATGWRQGSSAEAIRWVSCKK
jgi:hypothetical protein